MVGSKPNSGRGALAEDRDAGIEEALGEGAGMIGDIVLVDAGAERGSGALQKIEILQQKRHAGEGTVGKALVDLPPGIVVMLDDHRIDLRIDLGGAGDRLVQQFAGADLLLADEIGKADAVVIAVFRERHIDAPRDAESSMPAAANCSSAMAANLALKSAEHILIDDVLSDRFAVERAQNVARGLLAHAVDGLARHARRRAAP